MRKAVFKDFIRNIKGSLGRFFAIMAIVAIGVAFFCRSNCIIRRYEAFIGFVL